MPTRRESVSKRTNDDSEHSLIYTFRAEFMLDVIGAGATAVSDRDWHDVWLQSKAFTIAEADLERLHEEGRKHPPVGATLKSEFAEPWAYQAKTLVQRSFTCYWRDPTYLMSKLTLNIIGGLFIGFTFFKAKDSIQGTQNKLFVCHSRLGTFCGD